MCAVFPLFRRTNMAGGLKDGSDMKVATGCAHGSRTAPAGKYDGGKPPSGPKPTGWKLNGVKPPREKGVSK